MYLEKPASGAGRKGLGQACGIALLSLMLAGPVIAADEEAFSTDRPDFVDSPDPVGTGHVQTEAGLAYGYNKLNDGTQRNWSTPIMLRLGVARDVELRLETDGWQHVATGGAEPAHASGSGDLSVSTKWRLHRGDESNAGVALIGQLDLPAGHHDLHGYSMRPSLRLTSEFDLGREWSLGVMPGFIYDKDDCGRFIAGFFGASLGKDFAGSLHAFAEFAAEQIAATRHGGNQMTFDAGLAWQVMQSAQIDFAVSRGLNADSTDWQGTMGFSWRF